MPIMFKTYLGKLILFLGVISCVLACSSKDNPIDNVEVDCCSASSVIIFWQSDSLVAENFIKSVLTELKIEFKELSTQDFDLKNLSIDGIRDVQLSRLNNQNNKWASIMLNLNSKHTDKICQKLSSKSNSPVIAILEYDEAAWGYCLFQKGKLTDSFWNDHVIVGQTLPECTSNIDIIAEAFNVSQSVLQPYLIDISEMENQGKINTDDEFEIVDPWVRVDFMKHLGLVYPEQGKWLYIND